MEFSSLANPFVDYITKECLNDLLHVMTQTDLMQHYSVKINFVTLFEAEIELGDAILSSSESVLPLMDQWLVDAQTKLLENIISDDDKNRYCVKTKVHIRIVGLPDAEANKTVFPRNDALGNFLKVSGTVVKVTVPKLLEFEREYRCSKCRTPQTVQANYNLSHAILPPKVCTNLCAMATFTPAKSEEGCHYKDYQEVKIQEEVGKMHVGTMPSSIWITVDHDLVDVCHPGDNVAVWGTAMRRWKGVTVGSCGEVELVVKANNIQVMNHEKTDQLVTEEVKKRVKSFWHQYRYTPLEGRDVILASFCPDVYGLYLVKLAMCIVLCGGVPCTEDGGGHVRAESHLLMVGDPGTGKSRLLRFASRISARSILTTGAGSTSAGLTVSAVREGSDWQLEAGALVLADGGVCCIDELNSIRETDRTSIHEAMEQQTISVAKAGMVTKLNSRCSILAATNAKAGAYDPSESLSVNVALASPLLSRFDLVLVLQDTRSQDWDKLLSDFILELAQPCIQNSSDLWPLEDLQSYFALAKTLHPAMTPNANSVLCRYYQAQRGADSRNAARTTVRMLESLVRLSQGHARLMLREEVTLLDAVVAVTLMECSMASSALIASANALHAAFPTNPARQYRYQAELVLKKLNLEHLLANELLELDQQETMRNEESNKPIEKTLHEESRVDPTHHFSQRLNEILTGIQKKKDRNVCQVASLMGKRARENHVQRKKRKIRRLSDSDDEEKKAEDNILGNFEPIECVLEKETPKVKEKNKERNCRGFLDRIREENKNDSEMQVKSTGSDCEILQNNPAIDGDILKNGEIVKASANFDLDIAKDGEMTKSSTETNDLKNNETPKKRAEVNVDIDNIRDRRRESSAKKLSATTLDKLAMFKKPNNVQNETISDESFKDPIITSTPFARNLKNEPVTVVDQDCGQYDDTTVARSSNPYKASTAVDSSNHSSGTNCARPSNQYSDSTVVKSPNQDSDTSVAMSSNQCSDSNVSQTSSRNCDVISDRSLNNLPQFSNQLSGINKAELVKQHSNTSATVVLNQMESPSKHNSSIQCNKSIAPSTSCTTTVAQSSNQHSCTIQQLSETSESFSGPSAASGAGSNSRRKIDRDRLRSLANLGRALSQSQSQRSNFSQCSQAPPSSQFSLKEMDWDNLDVEL